MMRKFFLISLLSATIAWTKSCKDPETIEVFNPVGGAGLKYCCLINLTVENAK